MTAEEARKIQSLTLNSDEKEKLNVIYGKKNSFLGKFCPKINWTKN